MTGFSFEDDMKRNVPWTVIITFSIFTIGIIFIGVNFYNSQRTRIFSENQKNLGAITALKIDQIEQWQNERLGDAKTIKINTPLVDCIRDYFMDRNGTEKKVKLLNWLKSVCAEYDYRNVLIIDGSGRVRITVIPSDTSAGDKIGDEIESVFQSKQIHITDLHRSNSVQYIHLDLLIPLIDFSSKEQNTFGIMILRVDPEKNLFPLLQSWPVESKSSETLLLRQEGDSILYLNQLRYKNNSALNFKLPLSSTNLLGSMVVSGKKGMSEGIDYRNVPVVGFMSDVPGTTWYMVAKVDKEELQEPLKRYFYITIIVTILLILITFSIFSFWIWVQRAKLYRLKLKDAALFLESEEKFNIAFRMSPVTITLSGLTDNKFIDVNDTFIKDMEFSRHEVIGRTARDLALWADEEERLWVINQISQNGKIFGKVLRYKTKRGKIIYGLTSMEVVKVNGEACNLSTVINITDRVDAEEKLRKQYFTIKGLIESSRGPIFSLDTNYCYTSFNKVHSQVMKTLYGVEIELGKSILDFQTNEEDRRIAKGNIDRSLAGEYIEESAWSGSDPNNSRYFEVTHNPVIDENNMVVGVAVNVRDMTERKMIELKLKESEELYGKLFQNMLNGFAYCKILYNEGHPSDFIYLSVNEAFETQTGLKNVEGRKVSEIIPDIQILDPELLERYGRVAESGYPEVFETYVESMKMWFSISVYSPRKEYFVAVFDVITDRKKAEEQLRETNEYLTNLFNYANAPIIVWNNDLLITQFNHAFESLSGFYEEEVLGKRIDILFAPDKVELSLDLINRALSGERWETVEIEIQRKNSDSRIVLWNSANILDSDNKTVIATIAQGQDITLRKDAEKELRASENKFRQTFDMSPVGIVMVGLNKQFIRCNKSFAESLGYNAEDLAGKTITEITHPDDIQIGINDMAAIVKGELETSHVQKRYLKKGGSIVWAEVIISLIRDNAGTPQYFLAIIQDITENKRILVALQESEDKFKYVFDHSVTGKSITLPTGEINVNSAFCEMVGYTREELTNTKWQEISYPDDLEQTQDMIASLISGEKKSVRFIKRYIHKNGSIVWADLGTSLRKDSEGKPLYFMTSVLDITDRKLAEEAIRDNEKRFRDLIESLPQLFWTTRADGPCDYLSRQWVEYTGIPEADQLGYRWLEQLHPEDKDRTVSEWMEKVKTKESFDIEFRIRRNDGIYHWFKTRAVPMYDSSGDIIKWFGSNTDIDDIKNAAEQLSNFNKELEQRVIQRTEQLEAANKELEAFSYSVSHDLRAPLRAVHSYTNILLEDYEKILDDEGKRICGIISSSATQMGELIDDLLSFSRIGRSTLNPSMLNMKAMVDSIFEDMNNGNADNKTKIKIGKLHKAFGDGNLLKIVWTNLISNAIKYSTHVHSPEIVISSSQNDHTLTYAVKDNGVGFDMQYVHKLFGVFQRLHTEKEFEGNGVGLAIVKRIINRHGGKVWAEGEVDKGATFYFSLPASREGEKGRKGEREKGRKGEGEKGRKGEGEKGSKGEREKGRRGEGTERLRDNSV